MDKLIESGLFGDGLLLINKPYLIEKYNTALQEIGLQTTSLNSFHIDAWGWSPEISQELNNKYYLTFNGPANPFAIIITPEQEGRPIYFPIHSFDWDMISSVFNLYYNQIEDVTTKEAIWIDIDQEVTTYRGPEDLLLIDSINLKFNGTNGLMKAAQHQKQLVNRFLEDNDSWSNVNHLNQMIESVNSVGDLRYRSFLIPDTSYSKLKSFYTRAFDGVFVLKNLPSKKPLIIVENKEQLKNINTKSEVNAFEVGSYALFKQLFLEGLVSFDIRLYQNNYRRLERIFEGMIVNALDQQDIDYSAEDLNSSRRKRLIAVLNQKNALDEKFFELERILFLLKTNKDISKIAVSEALMLHVALPSSKLDQMTRITLWILLSKMTQTDWAIIYTYDKDGFFQAYNSWKPSKKEWVISFLKKNKDIFEKSLAYL